MGTTCDNQCVNHFNVRMCEPFFQISLHSGPQPAFDPDARDEVDNSWIEKNTSEYVRRYFMGVEARPSIAEQCIYTVSRCFKGLMLLRLDSVSLQSLNEKSLLFLRNLPIMIAL